MGYVFGTSSERPPHQIRRGQYPGTTIKQESLDSDKQFVPYTLTIRMENNDTSYSLYEALKKYRAELLSGPLDSPEILSSVNRLIQLVEEAWDESPNGAAPRG